MKKVKVIFASLILNLFFITVNAQEKPKFSEEKKQEMVSQMQESQNRLALTNEQQLPFRAITKRYAQKLKDLRGSSLDRQQKMEGLKVLMADKNAEMKTLLSEEQYKIYLQLQEERKAKIMQNRKQ